MALNFVNGGASLARQSISVTGAPITISGWFTYESAGQRSMVSIQDLDAIQIFQMGVGMSANTFYAATFSSGWASATVGSLSTDTLYHGMAVFTSPTARRAIVNGDWGGSGTNTTSKTPTGIDHVSLGAQYLNDGDHDQHDGDLSEAGIWNVALGEEENAMLAAGYSPLLVRPDALVFYWPGHNTDDQLIDRFGAALTLSAGTAPTAAAHPKIIYPSAQILQFPPAAAPAGGNEPLFYHHQRMLSRCS